MRLFKMFRLLKYNRNIKSIIEVLNLNPGVIKILKVTFTVLLLVHLVSCFYIMVAKFEDYNPDSWLVVNNLYDDTSFTQYITAVYWAFQTLTTVGYGDVTGRTVNERIFTLIWMIFGVAFYSFTIGNLQSIISTIDVKANNLESKLKILTNFAKQTDLPEWTVLKISRFLKNNNDNEESLLN